MTGHSASTCSDSERAKSPTGLSLNPRMHNRRLQYQRSVKCHWALISLSVILIWIHPWLPGANKAFRPHRVLIVQTLKPARLLLQLKWVDGVCVWADGGRGVPCSTRKFQTSVEEIAFSLDSAVQYGDITHRCWSRRPHLEMSQKCWRRGCCRHGKWHGSALAPLLRSECLMATTRRSVVTHE